MASLYSLALSVSLELSRFTQGNSSKIDRLSCQNDELDLNINYKKLHVDTTLCNMACSAGSKRYNGRGRGCAKSESDMRGSEKKWRNQDGAR